MQGNIWIGPFFLSDQRKRKKNIIIAILNRANVPLQNDLSPMKAKRPIDGGEKLIRNGWSTEVTGVNSKIAIVTRKFMSSFWTLIPRSHFTIGSHFLVHFSKSNTVQPETWIKFWRIHLHSFEMAEFFGRLSISIVTNSSAIVATVQKMFRLTHKINFWIVSYTNNTIKCDYVLICFSLAVNWQ